jgi:hypothetical protein
MKRFPIRLLPVLLVLSLSALVYTASAQTTALVPTISSNPVATSEDTIVAKALVVPKLDARFFHTTETSYHWWIVEHESGSLEDTSDGSITAEDLLRIEHTANCVSTHQGKHLMRDCEAVVTEGGAELEFSGGQPAYSGALRITLDQKLGYQCFFMAAYPNQHIPNPKFRITKKELKLKQSKLTAGTRIHGWLSVTIEELDSNTKPVQSFKIEGYFKPIIQHKK